MQWANIETSTKVILKVILALLALAFLWVIRDILIIVLLAIVLASALEPLVAYFQVKRVPRAVSVLTVYVLVLGLVGVIIALVVPVVAQQAQLLAANLPEYSAQLQARFPTLTLLLGNADLAEVLRSIFSAATGDASVFNKTVGIFNGFFSAFTILVISFYLVAEQKGMINFIRSLVPPKHQDFTMNLVRKIQNKMGLWVIGQIILSLSIFLLTYIGLSLLGIKYALFLALLAGVFEIIPYIGPFVSAVPAVFFALIQSPALAVAVAALYLLVQKTEGYFLVPKIMEKTVGTSPLLVLVSLLVGYKLAGIWGLLLAVPIVGAITVVVSELSSSHHQAEKTIEQIP
jgi:predicted PurR-regulated permease PerM